MLIEKNEVKAVYQPRLKTDKMLEAKPGSYSYSGPYHDAAVFVEGHQSKNVLLWKTFVEQYRLNPDVDDKGWRGEYWGKMMRGAAWIYKYTQNAELYAVLKGSVCDLLTTQDELGRFSTYSVEAEFDGWDMWSRKYILLGLQYFLDICEEAELCERVIAAMRRHLDYIMEKVNANARDILNTSTHWGSLNSASILEPVVRLYSITGDKKYLDYAEYIAYSGGTSLGNIMELALEDELAPYQYPVTKAYEMLSYFEGLLELWRINGDERLKTAYIRFLDKVIETDYTIIGCCGCTHELFDHSSIVQTEPQENIMQETCVTVTLMKACYQALCLTGNAKYADVIEKSGYNALLGSINFNKNTVLGVESRWDKAAAFSKAIGGFTFDSYSPLYMSRRNRTIGGIKFMGDKAYGCCACIGAAGVALMPISAVMLTAQGIAINQPMSGTFTAGDAGITVKTGYPYSSKITVKVDTGSGFKLEIREPWYAKSGVLISGEPATANELGYITLTDSANAGDVFEIEIPLEIKLHRLNGKLAVTRGAITYALDERVAKLDTVFGSDEVLIEAKIEPHYPCRDARRLTFTDGASAIFTDYASAGANWDDAHAGVTVWLNSTVK